MKNIPNFEEFINESFHSPDGTPIGVDGNHNPIKRSMGLVLDEKLTKDEKEYIADIEDYIDDIEVKGLKGAMKKRAEGMIGRNLEWLINRTDGNIEVFNKLNGYGANYIDTKRLKVYKDKINEEHIDEGLSTKDAQSRYNAVKNAADDLFNLFDEYEQDSDAKIAKELGDHIRKELSKMDFKSLMKKINKK